MSVRSRTLRLSVAAGTVAAAAAPMLVFGAAGSAQADPLCEVVIVKGNLVGYHELVNRCINYNSGTLCINEDIGGAPADVVLEVCVPAVLGLAGEPGEVTSGP